MHRVAPVGDYFSGGNTWRRRRLCGAQSACYLQNGKENDFSEMAHHDSLSKIVSAVVASANEKDARDRLSCFVVMEPLAEEQGIHIVLVVAWNCFQDGIAVAFIEGKRFDVVHSGFKEHGVAAGGAEPVLRHVHELGTHSAAPRLGTHINGDHVPDPFTVFFYHDESDDPRF